MAESDLHSQLVDRIVRSLLVAGAENFMLFVDGKSGGGIGVPPSIESVRPDVFARHVLTKKAIIGEAKTLDDVNNSHTEVQLESYFRFLAEEGDGSILLAVPWKRLDQMMFMAKRAQRITSAAHIRFSVSGWALPETDFCVVQHG